MRNGTTQVGKRFVESRGTHGRSEKQMEAALKREEQIGFGFIERPDSDWKMKMTIRDTAKRVWKSGVLTLKVRLPVRHACERALQQTVYALIVAEAWTCVVPSICTRPSPSCAASQARGVP